MNTENPAQTTVTTAATPVSAPTTSDPAHGTSSGTTPAAAASAVLTQLRIPQQPTPIRVAPDAGAKLRGRVLLEASTAEVHHFTSYIRANDSGLVLNGANALDTMRHLRAAHPDMFLAIDPQTSEKHFATEDDPFVINPEPDPEQMPLDQELVPTIGGLIDSQIRNGATVAVIPAGYLRAGEPWTLRAIVKAANTIDRTDCLLRIPMAYQCLSAANRSQLVAMLGKSRHPVAISMGDANGDPASRPGVHDTLRELGAKLEWMMGWRIDFAGLDVMAHGAKATNIGVNPSRRRAGIPDERGFCRNPGPPQILLEELLRFVTQKLLETSWYAATTPPGCPCIVCGGRRIDRFDGTEKLRIEGHQHNAAMLMAMVADASRQGGVAQWWPGKVADAVMAHTTLGGRVGAKIKTPKQLEAWAK